jgi:hypothetical protein
MRNLKIKKQDPSLGWYWKLHNYSIHSICHLSWSNVSGGINVLVMIS